jgi:methylthioribose-1-phosphate isomerase
MGLLTHCNAGHLAVSEYGTALAPIYLGQEQGFGFSVFADETRPLLQGARLTAFELQKAGVDVTLICDNMTSSVMKQGWVQAVLVGCDRVAANGDTANKIGTSGVAVLAKYYGIPFYVLGPTSTIDMDCPTGKEIKIEERDPAEVTEKWYTRRMAPEGIHVYNPAFDVTSAELITAIITEKGIAFCSSRKKQTPLAQYPPHHLHLKQTEKHTRTMTDNNYQKAYSDRPHFLPPVRVQFPIRYIPY